MRIIFSFGVCNNMFPLINRDSKWLMWFVIFVINCFHLVSFSINHNCNCFLLCSILLIWWLFPLVFMVHDEKRILLINNLILIICVRISWKKRDIHFRSCDIRRFEDFPWFIFIWFLGFLLIWLGIYFNQILVCLSFVIS